MKRISCRNMIHLVGRGLDGRRDPSVTALSCEDGSNDGEEGAGRVLP